MDGVSKIMRYWPTGTLCIYWVIANLIISDVSECATEVQQLVKVLLSFCAVICFCTCFTDTFTASDNSRNLVLLVPFYGPVCGGLPSDYDKDRLYERFHLKLRDYVHAFVSTTAFVIIGLFSNPAAACLYPSGNQDGTTRFDPAVVRALPIMTAALSAVFFAMMGEPRQCLGYMNSVETAPGTPGAQAPSIGSVTSNPMYAHNPDAPMEPAPPGNGKGGPAGLAGPPSAAYARANSGKGGIAALERGRGSNASGFDAASFVSIGGAGMTDDGALTPDQISVHNGSPGTQQYPSGTSAPAAAAAPQQLMGYNAASRPMSYNGGAAPARLGHSASAPRPTSYNGGSGAHVVDLGGGSGGGGAEQLGYRSRSPSMGPPPGNAYWVEGTPRSRSASPSRSANAGQSSFWEDYGS